MLKKRARRLAAGSAGLMALSLGLAACGGGDGGGGGGSNDQGLIVLTEDPIDHLDPQRIYVGADIAMTNRLVYRQLLSYPNTEDVEAGTTPVPDIATDTGTSKQGAKVWSFTIKEGVKWEDGSDVTCDDFKYGASRNFASETLVGGPGLYLTQKLDIPRDGDSSAYKGPYDGTGQEHFDKAVTCDGNTITYRFNSPWPDFPLAIASLHMMDPYKESFDKGAKNDDVIFSNGPYMVEDWDAKKGGTLVRNPEYDPETDSPELREAKPEKITFQYGETGDAQYERLFSDAGDAAYTIPYQSRVSPTYFSRLGEVEDRYTQVESPYIDYLVPNQAQMSDPQVRQALAVSTNVQAWIDAGGGEKAFVPADSIVNPKVHGYVPNPAFEGRDLAGDVEEAKRLLQQAGVQTPYPIKFSYPQSDSRDKMAAALKQTWDEAGFDVQLDPLGQEYYSKIQKPGNDADVMWGGWGADWPSAITVTAPLFDSRQINKASTGQNYGQYKNPEVDALFDQAAAATTLDEQTQALQQADAQMGEDVAYIPLENEIFNWVHGSKVTGFTTTPASNGFPEFASIDVED